MQDQIIASISTIIRQPYSIYKITPLQQKKNIYLKVLKLINTLAKADPKVSSFMPQMSERSVLN